MIGIYKITNKINNKCYIGRSIDIEHRWKTHRTTANQKADVHYNYPLYKAFRKYGVQNFIFEILEICDTPQLGVREQFYITKYKSNNPRYGYNQTAGGECDAANQKFFPKDIQDLIFKLRHTDERIIDIAKEYKVTEATIINFDKGKTYHNADITYPIRQHTPNKKPIKTCVDCGAEIHNKSTRCWACYNQYRKPKDKPDALSLAKQIFETSFEQVGKYYGVSGKAIAKWCKSYGIPHTIKELKQWYATQMQK